MNYYERHLGDYAKDTGHLSMLEHGAYTLLLDRYYSKEEGIPAGEAYRVARAHSKQERGAVDKVLGEFFVLSQGIWIKNRVQEEIAAAHVRIGAAQTNGKLGGRPRKKPKTNPTETQQKPSGLLLGSEIETQSKALQSPVSNLNPKSGSAAPVDDPRKQIFELGKTLLGANSGGLISKAIAETDEATVGAVLGEMALKPKADPRAYFAAATKTKERGLVA